MSLDRDASVGSGIGPGYDPRHDRHMTTPITFAATIERSGATATGIEVPETVLASLGAGNRPSVTITINGASFTTTLGSMGGRVMIPLSAEGCALTGTVGGDQVDVTIALHA
jgi:hypothetical protein